MPSEQLKTVQDYYGKVLKTKNDLKTTACCSAEAIPIHLRKLASQIHPEVIEKFYGCGCPFPPELNDQVVLDLGSGSGRDCFMLSKLVGSKGHVIGVDMTDEQLAVAQKHLTYHTEKFKYERPNIRFAKGFIEDLSTADIADESVDLVVSNCVINLSPDKHQVFSEIFRVLKPGGELYFSDVFSDRRLPAAIQKDPVFIGECLGGALYLEDFRRTLFDLGCRDYRIVSQSPIELQNAQMLKIAGPVQFYSITLRAFKLELEDRCEDYGQVAYYLGTLPESPGFFTLDDHHRFEKNKPHPVCSNTAQMLSQTRYAKHFRVEGDLSTHFGLFDCGPTASSSPSLSGCC